MKYRETGHRGVYMMFCVFPLNDVTRPALQEFPGADEADGVLGLGYIDKEGMKIEVIASAKKDGDAWRFADTNPDVRSNFSVEAILDDEFEIVDDSEGDLNERYQAKFNVMTAEMAAPDLEQSRAFDFLDAFRNILNPDEVSVVLVRYGLEDEACWVRITGLGDRFIIGELLDEPKQKFGFHKGEKIGFFVQQLDEQRIRLVSNMNPDVVLTHEMLADGKMLKEAVAEANKDRNEMTVLSVLELLRDSMVWIPCNVVMSERDQEALKVKAEEEGEGATISNQDDIRMMPDVLKSGENTFFPVFSSPDEMGEEYGAKFSKLQKPMLEVLQMAKSDDPSFRGIVLNAWTEPFVLDKELFAAVAQMKSRIEE